MGFLDELYRYGQPAASLATGALAEPAAGWAGLFGGDIDKTRQALTYHPSTPQGQQGMDAIANALARVTNEPHVRSALDAYKNANDYVGDKSPLAGAAMAALPTAAMMFFGPGGSSVRGAFGSAGRSAAGGIDAAIANAGAVPAMRGPLSAQQGMFAGHLSKTADLEKLALAKDLQSAGAPDDFIHAQTGWFNGMPDKQWRYEIPDNTSKLDSHLLGGDVSNWSPTAGVKSGMAFKHPELYEAYPDLAKINTQGALGDLHDIHGPGGSFNPEKNMISAWSETPEDMRSTMLHELQHAAQAREGFAPGGNASMFAGITTDPKVQAESYRRLAGEAEARLTQKRMNYTPEERASIYPPSEFDVTPDMQLIRRGGGTSMEETPYAYPQDAAMDMARQNAVKMLGLPEGNTAMDRAKALGFDMDNKYYAGSHNPERPEKIYGYDEVMPRGENYFGGIFASTDKDTALSHGDNLSEFVARKEPLTSSDLQYGDVGNKANKYFGNLVGRLKKGERNELYDAVLGGKGLYDVDVPEDRLTKIFRGGDLGEADWRAQGMRGEIGKRLGYPVVEMPDEHSISYLLNSTPGGVRRTDAAFDPARIMENNLLGAANPQLLKYIAGGALAAPYAYNKLYGDK